MYEFKTEKEGVALPGAPSSTMGHLADFFSQPVKRGRDGGEADVRATSPSRGECETLARLATHFRPERTLEFGLACGGSAVAIISAKRAIGCKARHIALNPYPDHTHHVGELELQRLGLAESCAVLPHLSEVFLPEEAAKGNRYDFVFVDGIHTIGQKVTDAFFVDRVMAPGGVVAFHDGLLFSTAAAVRFLVRERGYRILGVPVDSAVRATVRRLKYIDRLGLWYCRNVVRHMHRSLVVLRARETRGNSAGDSNG